jgi:hypothetical protein
LFLLLWQQGAKGKALSDVRALSYPFEHRAAHRGIAVLERQRLDGERALPSNAPTIDDFPHNVALSIKSIDLNSPWYGNPANLYEIRVDEPMQPRGWHEDKSKRVQFPPGTPVEHVIERLIAMIQDCARQ